jgi:hypothetical protein
MIITSIFLMALLGSIGMICHNKASADTYTERYSKGMSDGYTDCSNNKEYNPDSQGLVAHTHAYQNGYNQGIYNCNHNIPEVTSPITTPTEPGQSNPDSKFYKSSPLTNVTETTAYFKNIPHNTGIGIQVPDTTSYIKDGDNDNGSLPSSSTFSCDVSTQKCSYNDDGSSHPISNNDNHQAQVDSSTVNLFPRHCDIGGWPSCYQTGYNAGFSDGKAGIGNGNCYGKHSANFCSGYSNGWQAAHRKDNSNINSNNQIQTSKQVQNSTNNNIPNNNQNSTQKNNLHSNSNTIIYISPNISPTISPNISPNISSNSGSASNTNSTSKAGSLSGSNSGSASNAGHNK